jgi:hypothetical protein
LPFDKFGNNYFYPSKSGGFNFEMSSNPKNDTAIEGLDSDFSTSGNVITMHCNGATSFSVGKNARSFSDSIGGCSMDFAASAKRGYTYKADDVRDLEFKCWMRVPNNLSSGHDGFSMSACTGHHTSSSCCQGFAYMGSLEGINSNPTKFRFRKETVHVEYTDAPETVPPKSHPKMNFKVAGHDFIGFGFCRYNKPTSGGTSPQDDSVILEIWFNPDPTNDATDWTMLMRIEDKKGKGWTGSKNKCNGDSDQIGVWSGAHNRLKSNSTSGTIEFTNISFREINPFGTFDENPPPPPDCGTGFHRDSSGACVPNTVDCGPGKHQDGSGNCVDDEPNIPPPTEPTKVKGIFSLKRDINIYRDDACEGTGGSGGGGGGGGRGIFYDALPDNDKPLSDTSLWFFRTRLAAQINKVASGAFNKVLKQLSVPLKKVGSPAATPTVTAVIWDKNNNVIYTSPTAVDPTTLPTSFDASSLNWVQFDFSANTHIFVLGDRVGVRYYADSPTSDVNYVVGGYETVTNPLNNTMIQYESSVWKEFPLRDFACVMYD